MPQAALTEANVTGFLRLVESAGELLNYGGGLGVVRAKAGAGRGEGGEGYVVHITSDNNYCRTRF